MVKIGKAFHKEYSGRQWPEELPPPPEDLVKLIDDFESDFSNSEGFYNKDEDPRKQLAALVFDWFKKKN